MFDAYTAVYDHKPVAVEIKGSIVSQEILSKIPRLDKRWIKTESRKRCNKMSIMQKCSQSRTGAWTNTSTGKN